MAHHAWTIDDITNVLDGSNLFAAEQHKSQIEVVYDKTWQSLLKAEMLKKHDPTRAEKVRPNTYLHISTHFTNINQIIQKSLTLLNPLNHLHSNAQTMLLAAQTLRSQVHDMQRKLLSIFSRIAHQSRSEYYSTPLPPDLPAEVIERATRRCSRGRSRMVRRLKNVVIIRRFDEARENLGMLGL